jgi:hypothetical protein
MFRVLHSVKSFRLNGNKKGTHSSLAKECCRLHFYETTPYAIGCSKVTYGKL